MEYWTGISVSSITRSSITQARILELKATSLELLLLASEIARTPISLIADKLESQFSITQIGREQYGNNCLFL
jgi:hypothetical protein